MTEITDGHLRVSTAQREHALELLRNAAADGRLDFDELDVRVPRAVGALTRNDLAGVLGDLVPAADLADAVGEATPAGDGPGYTWDRPLLMRPQGWSTFAMAGDWIAPPFIEIATKQASVWLDFTQARVPSPVIDLVVTASGWTSVNLVVPDGWGVDTTAVTAGYNASVTCDLPTRPTPGLPRIIIRGRVGGTLKVRTPTDRTRRKAAKLAAQRRPELTA